MIKKDKTSVSSRQVFIRLIKTMNGQYPLIFLSVFFAFISTILQLLIPVLTGRAIDLTVYGGDISNISLWKLLKFMILIIVASSILTWIMNRINLSITY